MRHHLQLYHKQTFACLTWLRLCVQIFLLASVPPEDLPFYRDISPYIGRDREGTPFLKDISPYMRDASPFIRDTTPFIPETRVPSSYYPRSYYTRPFSRSLSPVPIYSRPRPIYLSRPYSSLYNPSPSLPMSAIVRDPWWYGAGLRPYSYVPRYPSALRTSYLSPIKNRYLWTRHPMRVL